MSGQNSGGYAPTRPRIHSRKGVMGNAPNYHLMLYVALIYPTKHLWALASVVKSPQEGQRTVNNLHVGSLNKSTDASYFQSPHAPTILAPSSQVKLRTLFFPRSSWQYNHPRHYLSVCSAWGLGGLATTTPIIAHTHWAAYHSANSENGLPIQWGN